jgi:hypothetical protein
VSSSGFRDGLGERDLSFDRQTGDVWERLFLRPELSAFEAALRERIARFTSFQSSRLVSLRSADRDVASPKLIVVSRHVPGSRLSDLLRSARERELVPDFTVALLLSAEIFAALHAFHALSGVSHGAMNADRVIVSPAGDVILADFVYGEVLEAAQFSKRRLWEQFGVAHWYDAPFSREADIRHGLLTTIALMLGRLLDHEDFPNTLDDVLTEVEEAAMIRGGRLFAEPVIFWLNRALAAGTPTGFESAEETSEACLSLLTDRERETARPALLQFFEDALAPVVVPQPAIEPSVVQVVEPEPAAAFEAETEPAWEPFEPEPEPEPVVLESEPEPIGEPFCARAEAVTFPTPDPEPEFAPIPDPFVEPPQPVPVASAATAVQPGPMPPPSPRAEPAWAVFDEPAPAVPWSPPPASVFDMRPDRPHVVSASPFATIGDAAGQSITPAVTPPPPVSFAPHPAPARPPVPEPIVQAPAIAFAPGVLAPPPAPVPASPAPILVPPPSLAAPAAVVPPAAPIEPQPSGIRLKTPSASTPRRATSPSRGLNLSDYESSEPAEPDQQAQFAKFWKFVAGGAVLLVAGLAAAQVEWTTPEVKIAPGVLVVETTPPGSDVFIDGEARGKTPTTMEVDPGKHEIRLARDGATHSWSVDVVSGARRVERLNWSALQQTGGIEVVTNAPGSAVLVDGQRRGQTPLVLTDIPPGRHIVVVQGPSGSVRRVVNIAAGKTAKIDLQIYSGWIVVSAPIELQIVEKGSVIATAGEGPVVLPAGRHDIELVNEALGYRSTRTVDIQPGEEERITVTPTGLANINATPWAEVFVDGNRLGETPLANVSIPLGTRDVVFRHPQFGERRVTVTITGGAPAQVSIDFSKS